MPPPKLRRRRARHAATQRLLPPPPSLSRLFSSAAATADLPSPRRDAMPLVREAGPPLHHQATPSRLCPSSDRRASSSVEAGAPLSFSFRRTKLAVASSFPPLSAAASTATAPTSRAAVAAAATEASSSPLRSEHPKLRLFFLFRNPNRRR